MHFLTLHSGNFVSFSCVGANCSAMSLFIYVFVCVDNCSEAVFFASDNWPWPIWF